MPTPAEILSGLTATANQHIGLALTWHVVLAVVFSALFLGWKPSSRQAGGFLSLLPFSVATAAWVSGNPFNAAALGVLAVVLAWTSFAHRPVVTALGMPWFGAALIAYGWCYPHFLESQPLIAYAVAAPLGLVPCPTLALLIGLALRKPRLFSGPWLMALVAAGAFYGAVGVLRLVVYLDVGLFVGAMALLRVFRTASTEAAYRTATA